MRLARETTLEPRYSPRACVIKKLLSTTRAKRGKWKVLILIMLALYLTHDQSIDACIFHLLAH